MSTVGSKMGSTRNIVPLRLESTDYLGIDLIAREEKTKKFLLRARSLTQNSDEKVGNERYTIHGETFFDHWSGPSFDAVKFLNESLYESSFDKRAERHSCPATDLNAVTILRSWSRERLVFVSDEARREFDRLISDFEFGESVAIQAARFKNEGVVPALPEAWRERKDCPLSAYQRTAVKLALDVPAFMLHMDRGTGKTPCAIQYINTLALMLERGEISGGVKRRDGGKMLRVLVVAPKNVRLNWKREFEKFSHVPGKVSTLRGGASKRVRCLAAAAAADDGCSFSVLIASYDGVRTTADYLAMLPWDAVVIDEAHAIKDPNTERFKALLQIRNSSARRLELTGTPIGNSPADLFAQFEFAREGASGFTSRRAFRDFHGVFTTVDNGAQGIQKLIGLQNVPLLQERLARMSFSISKEEAGLHLPDKVRSVTEVQMTQYQADVYNRLSDQLALEIEDKLSGEIVDEITVKNVLTMLLRLAQITSGFITYDAKIDPDTKTVITPSRQVELSETNPKVQALLDLLQDEDRDPKAKTIVWCQFIHNIHIISEALTKAGIKHGCYYGGTSSEERDRLVDGFNNDPDFKVLVCNPQTAGEGLNLLGYNLQKPEESKTYCDMEVFFSIGWSAILRAQAEDRAHRRGTRMPVQIIDLVVPGSIDEEILKRITNKREMAETVSDLKDTLLSILRTQVEVDAS